MAIVKISDLPLVDQPVEGTDLFVVVQDNVTKKAYASDIQTYVGFEEFQTATAGQTVFNLTTMTYAAGANNLQVFVDGVNQYVGTSYLETDNNTVTFTQGLHQGALVKFATVQTLSTVDTSSANILFTEGDTGAVTRSVQSKLRDTVSVKDFGAVGDGVTDDTAAIQAAINAAYFGKVIFPPGIYVHTGIVINKGIELQGAFPLTYPDVDVIVNNSRGTILWKKTAGNSVTIQAAGYPSSYADSEFNVRLSNIAVIGARYTGSTFISNSVTTGHGIVVNAGDATEAAIHLDLENIFCFSHPERGWSITGQVFGCNANWIGAVYNGKTGFYVSKESFSNIPGEWHISHYRGFWNGELGSTDIEKAGVYLDPNGNSMVFGLLTSSNNYGPNFYAARGGFDIQKLHCETQAGTPTASPIIFGNGTNTTIASVIDAISVDPGNSYANDVIKFNAAATKITINSLKIGDSGLVGNHVSFANTAAYNRINTIWSADPVKIADSDGRNLVASYLPAFSARLTSTQSNVTGDGTVITLPLNIEFYDTANGYNTSTYKFTAPVTGIYDLSAQAYFTGADGSNHNEFVISIVTSTDVLARSVVAGLKPTDILMVTSKKQLLAKGTQIYVEVSASGGGKTVDITANSALTYFSGSLIVPTQASGAPWY